MKKIGQGLPWMAALLGHFGFPGFCFPQSQEGGPPTSHIFIDTSPPTKTNYVRYYNDIAQGVEVLKEKGQGAIVLAKDGTWKLTRQKDEKTLEFSLVKGKMEEREIDSEKYQAIHASFESLENLKKVIPQNRGGLVFYFAGHGHAPTAPGDPGSSGFYLWKEKLQVSWNQFGTWLQIHFPESPIKIITNTCYGGGVHELARTMNNICTAATVPSFYPSSSGYKDKSVFFSELWKNILDKGMDQSFFATVGQSFQNDIPNSHAGQTSSMYYLDFVFKRGAFHKDFNGDPPKVGDWKIDSEGRKYWKWIFPEFYSSSLSFGWEKGFTKLFPQWSCTSDEDITALLEASEATKSYSPRDLDLLLEDYKLVVKEMEGKGLPGNAEQFFLDSFKKLRKYWPGIHDQLKLYSRDMTDLASDWKKESLGDKPSKSASAFLKLYQQKLEAIERDLGPFFYYLQTFEYLRKINLALSTEKKEVREKLLSLLTCEFQRF